MEQKNKKTIIAILFILIIGIGAYVLISNYKNDGENVLTNDQVQRDRKDAEKQIVELTKKENEGTKDIEIKRNLARAYYLVGDIENSEKFIKEALAVNEKSPQYYVDLGLIYQSKGDMLSAEEQFKKAVELNVVAYPDPILLDFPPEERTQLSKQFPPMVYKLPSPYIQLARLYIEQGKNDEAIIALKEGILVLPAYPDFYLMLSELYKDKDITKMGLYRKQFESLLAGIPVSSLKSF